MNDYDEGAAVQIADVRAERSVLGAVMLDAAVVWDVAEHLRPADFSDPSYGAVYEGMLELANANRPLDAIAVGDHLRRTGRTNDRVNDVLLHTLTSEVPTATNAAYYAGIVSDLAKRRRLQAVAQQIAALPTAQGDVEGLIESAREAIDDVSTATVRAPRKIGDRVALDGLVEALDEKPQFVSTPWPALDRIIGGFRPGGLYVVAARPGIGKTVVGLQVARELAKSGPVGFVSLEMGEHEIQTRLVASMGSVTMDTLTNHQLTESDWHRFADVRAELERLSLFVHDGLSTSLQVVSFARTLHRMGGMRGLVIDYLTLLRTGEKHESRRLEVEAMTRTFKQLAQRLGIPVILLSQLNRQGLARGKGKPAPPRVEDLRESGSIEQDADVVMLLHRESARSGELKVFVAKNRHGSEGEFALGWEGQFARAVPKKWTPTGLLNEKEVA